MSEGDGLPGGWTLDEITGIARHVARLQYGRIIDLDEARDVAAVGLVERLYADPPPTRSDLYRAAQRAVGVANDKEMSYCGLNRNVARNGREGPPRGWATYWHGRSLVSPFEEDLVERVAVAQVWRALRPRDQETLAALVAHGSYEDARAALGASVKAWENRIHAARVAARTLWYSPEEPARQWMPDRPGRPPDPRGRNYGLLHIARQRRAARHLTH